MTRASCLTLVASLCLLAGANQPAGAAILSHNGTTSPVSTPGGTGDVDVTVTNLNFGEFPDDLVEMDLRKEFSEIATHQAQASFFAFEIPAFETVINASTDPWGEFRIELVATNPIRFLGADVDADNPAPLIDPVGANGPIEFAPLGLSEVTLLSSSIEQPSVNQASLVIQFANAVDPGDGFTLRFGIHHDTVPSEPGFTMTESPVFGESIDPGGDPNGGGGGNGGSPPGVIPEPSSLLTFGGLALCAALGALHRRRRKKQKAPEGESIAQSIPRVG